MKTAEQASNFIIGGFTISGNKVSETEWQLFINRVEQIQQDAFTAGQAKGREDGMREAAKTGPLTHPQIHLDYYKWLETTKTDTTLNRILSEKCISFSQFHTCTMHAWSCSRETAQQSILEALKALGITYEPQPH